MTKPAKLVLNPYSLYGKEFLPEEVEKMLAGKLFADSSKEIQTKVDSKILLGQPKVYPTEAMESLKILFASRSNVKAAYIGLIVTDADEGLQHLVFGLDADGSFPELAQEVAFTIKECIKEKMIFDVGNVRDPGSNQ